MIKNFVKNHKEKKTGLLESRPKPDLIRNHLFELLFFSVNNLAQERNVGQSKEQR